MNEDRQVAIVTGAGAGIGRAIAFRLARAGYAVAVADIDPDGANRVTQELRANAAPAETIICDVGDKTESIRMVAAATEALGPRSLQQGPRGGPEVLGIHRRRQVERGRRLTPHLRGGRQSARAGVPLPGRRKEQIKITLPWSGSRPRHFHRQS